MRTCNRILCYRSGTHRIQWGASFVQLRRGFVGATTLATTTLSTTTMSRTHLSALNAY